MDVINSLFSSSSLNGMKTDTLAFGTPNPLFAVILPATTP